MNKSKCRFCNTPLTNTFVNLGMSPISNAFLKGDQLNQGEKFYPLHVYVCDSCYLVQLEEFETPDKIFSDYVYFSSFSDTWLKHAEDYTNEIVANFGLDKKSQVIEIASNDGYLLQYFKERGIPILGIEPAENVADVARSKGIPTMSIFFGTKTAKELVDDGYGPDLVIGNNVLAHVPDLNDFVEGIKILLKSTGIFTLEFPHVLRLMAENQFDTIYHEHFSYFSLLTLERIFATHNLTIFDVKELSTHGGSLRIYGRHSGNNEIPVRKSVQQLHEKEKEAGLDNIAIYEKFSGNVKKIKVELLDFLIQANRKGKVVIAYGAPAKGNTLLNYCGIREDFIRYTVDRSPYKQGLFLPGTHIPVYHPDKIRETRPDFVLILPWNIKEEIMDQLDYIKDWGGCFVIPIPELKVL